MNNLVFYNFQLRIQKQMDVLEVSRDEHIRATGYAFISGQHIDEPKFCDTCRFYSGDLLGMLCYCEDSEFYEDRDVKLGCSEWDDEGGT